ncbi:PTS lactose/cellobiose transporter subunit IIA [Lacticaseibacillus camelliae]|nr:PTS lactose/cellobiose transporter subunit IIA [Lacticaseibacillus camelliae]
MNEEGAQVAMKIIYYAGNAKSSALQAIDAAFSGDQDKATAKLAEAKKQLNSAHNIQTSLMTDEMNGKMIEKSIILIHAQDQFMAANTEIELGERLIKFSAKALNS